MSALIHPEALIAGARAVLRKNDLGRSTKPAPGLYPHQWNWDSCFIAIGLAHYEPERAADELRSLLRGQWRNGLVPQIVFTPGVGGYFPGPDEWQSERSPDAPRAVRTSGITQPPVLATSALAIYRHDPDETRGTAFLREVYPGILRYHRFLYEERDPDASGLIVVVHPWESGLDNSPPYLDAGRRVHITYKPVYERLDLQHVSSRNRPSDADYDLYIWLLKQMRAVNWDQKRYLDTAQLQVRDVLFNAILCKANADLAEIARIVGEDPTEPGNWAAKTSAAINRDLWHTEDNTYYSFDRVAGTPLRIDTVSAFATLYGDVATRERADILVREHLTCAKEFWPETGYPIPSTAMSSPWFNSENYWLGPTWVNTNWMIVQGLRAYGYASLAKRLSAATLRAVSNSGYREYFSAVTGEGYGTDDFSWTAALVLDLLQ